MAETIQAADSVAAIPRRIPGALLMPKIATSPQNETAARMKRFVCIGLLMRCQTIKSGINTARVFS